MLLDHLRQQLADRDAQQQRRVLKVCQTSDGARMRVVTAAGQPARDLLAFCSNDYLGLAHHPDVVAAMGEGALRHGAGSGASHLVSGHSPAHALLEEELARWMAPCIPGARALFFGTGYLANLALLTALGDARATVFADKLNHASLVDGGLLARAEFVRYPHNRTDRLAQQLAACATPIKLIATDAVFSMDGDIAPLAELLRLAEAHDAWPAQRAAHLHGHAGQGGGRGRRLRRRPPGGGGRAGQPGTALHLHHRRAAGGGARGAEEPGPGRRARRRFAARPSATAASPAARALAAGTRRARLAPGGIDDGDPAADRRRQRHGAGVVRGAGAARPVGARHPPADRAGGQRAAAHHAQRGAFGRGCGPVAGGVEGGGDGGSSTTLTPTLSRERERE
jgi:hypothetical protein